MKNNRTWLIVIVGLGIICALTLVCGVVAWNWWSRVTPETVGFEPPVTPTPATGQPTEPPAVTPAPPGGLKRVTPGATPVARGSDPGEGTQGGTLRLYGELPPTLDPALAQDSSSAEYIVHLFAGLVTLNADLEVVPDLATGWDVEDDGRTYVFDLNPAAAFADGTPITTDDFIYSYERACDPGLGSPVALTYLGDIVGTQAYAAGAADSIVGLVARDTHTLAITIDAPKAYFLAKLTYPVAFVVDHNRIERDGERWMLDPNGSGPFVLEELSDSRIVLARNDRYAGRQAHLDRVEFTSGGGLPMTMYENGELDIVGVGYDELDRVMDPHNALSAELYVEPELSTEYLGLDVERPPFDDPDVRLAILKAIDREKLATVTLNNSVVAARGIMPPGLMSADPDPAAGVMAYDPVEARRLLDNSSYGAEGSMPEIVLSISGTSGYMPDVTRAVLAMLEENLGLRVTVEQVEWSDFLNDLNRRTYALYESGWIADYPDPQNFLDLLFHSASGQNHQGYANAEVDALLEAARTEQDPDRRMALYAQAEVLILQDAPWVPLSHGVAYTLAKPGIGGYTGGGAGLYPWLRDVFIAD